MEEDLEQESNSYRLAIFTLYLLGIGLNLWFLAEIMRESEEGKGQLARIKNSLFKPFQKTIIRHPSPREVSALLAEAEEVLRSNNA